MNNKNAYQKKYNKKQNNKPRKIILLTLLITLLMTASYLVFRYFNNRQKLNDSVTKTTSTAPSAQDTFTGAEERPVLETSEKDKGSASIDDTQGTIIPDSAQDQWTISQSGEITVYTPSKSQLLKTGDTLSGKSTLSAVSYRIIDSVSGVISEGQLNVVDGKFSGSINFSTTATEGRLDIYSSNSEGVEFSNVEIPVRFK